MDESGEVLGVFAAARDITELKRMEAELEYIARLPKENPNPVIRLDRGHKISFINTAGQIMLTDWGCATNQEVPTEVTEMVIAALTVYDVNLSVTMAIEHSLQLSFRSHKWVM